MARWFSAVFSPGCDLGDPGLSPTLGSLHGACFSLCLCLCLSLSLSLSFSLCVSHERMNKILKKRKQPENCHLRTKYKRSRRCYLFMRDADRERKREREREAETQAEGEVSSMQGARSGTRSWVSRIAPWAKGRRQTATPPRDP